MKPSLILLGHGSTENPDSSDPTHRHAQKLRETDQFAEVQCAFWKEQPSFHEIEKLVEGNEIYVVPLFISEGYFTQEIIPRELKLDGAITHRDNGKVIKYCSPVGIHDKMTDLLLKRAKEVAPDCASEDTSILIVGHGTSLNKNSTLAVKAQADRIREGGHGYAEVLDTYMEEPPLIENWKELTTSPNVVVVPFFIADALHSYEDIPVMLGLETAPIGAASKQEVFRKNPRQIDDRNLYYSSAIGTDPSLVDVILDQISNFDKTYPTSIDPKQTSATPLSSELKKWIEDGKRRILEVAITSKNSGYILTHIEDKDTSIDSLTELKTTQSILEMNRWDNNEEYRPRPAGKTMQTGWYISRDNESSLLEALNALYPGAISHYRDYLSGSISPTPLRDTLARQTGMYQNANKISDQEADELICTGCAAEKCARTILYPLNKASSITGLSEEKFEPYFHGNDVIPFFCIQACCFPVAGARLIAKKSNTN